jgi:hypothetical protein
MNSLNDTLAYARVSALELISKPQEELPRKSTKDTRKKQLI